MTKEIFSTGACSECTAERYHDRLESIGSPVQTDEGIAGTTHYDILQCSDCGSVIARYSDRGLGKGGPFFKRITAGLF